MSKEIIPETSSPQTQAMQDGNNCDPRTEELDRIVHSDTFSKSPRLAALLKHICERTWAGHVDELSEQQIGIHFFHRPPGFNAGEDAIVRGSARHLRKRLDLYYGTEGKHNPGRILVPKGGYVARFEDATSTSEPNISERDTTESHPIQILQKAGKRFWLWTAIPLLAVAIVGFFLWQHNRQAQAERDYGSLLLWKTLFQGNRRTVIVAGDAALNLYTAYTHQPVPLLVYMEQRYQNDPAIQAISPEGPGLLSRVNAATMADLKLTSELVRIPYRLNLPTSDKDVEVRYARDVNQGDLQGANLILLGTSTFNPWSSIYDSNLDFHLDRGYEHYTFQVVNRAPRNGEAAIITKNDAQALTTVALTDTPSGNEHVLLLGGSTMGSVYAAEHFLFTQRMWQPILNAATINGKLHGFEVVLRSDFVKDEVSNTTVVAYHIH
ncbi:hypothetical protein [Terriglobus roseus]|uniref:hypothetical protein n=1 Tax=Terriglobus roseus TaxID=392734 RepID=UPI0009F39461|nr:hypothetical protein [Terriglobus roseus]